MLRRLFTLLSFVSLVLCVAVCGLWVRSYVSTNVPAEVGDPPRFLLMTARGQAVWQALPARPLHGDATAVEGWHGWGFASYREHHGPASRYCLAVPFWFLALALAVPPARRLPGLLRPLARRQGRRSAAGWVRGRWAAAHRSGRSARRPPSWACAASAVLVLGAAAAVLWLGPRPGRDRDVLPPAGPPPPPGVNPDAVAPKVLLYVFDPVMENLGGVRQHAAYGWQDPVALAARVAAALAADSHGLVTYRVVRTVVADAHPYFADGFRHTDASFAAAWAARDFHAASTFDYPRFVRENDLAARVDAGEVDEVWVYAGPVAGMYESVMAGRGAYWINGPAQPGGRRAFPIMGWNFERGLAEALHSYGHRAEGTMDHLYGTQRPNRDNNWNRFTFQDRYAAGRGSGTSTSRRTGPATTTTRTRRGS